MILQVEVHVRSVMENTVMLAAFNANFWQKVLEQRFAANLRHTFHFGKDQHV